jgi:hypothetical protein
VNYQETDSSIPASWDRLQGAVEAALLTGAPCELVLEMVRADGTHRWIMARGEAQRDSTGHAAGLAARSGHHGRKVAEEALSSVNGRLIEAQSQSAPGSPETCTTTSVSASQCWRWRWNIEEAAAGCLGRGPQRLWRFRSRPAEIITGVQALSHELHPPRLLHLALWPQCEVSVGGSRGRKTSRLIAATRTFLERTARCIALSPGPREALNNAVRHGQVRHNVHLRGTGDAVHLTIRDEGVGFDIDAASLGLGLGMTSMRERLKLVGGELFIESRSTHGTTVLARAPVSRS